MATYIQIGSTVTVGAGGASSIDFTSIPATYTDLKLVVSGRINEAVTYDSPVLYFNGSTANFTFRQIYGTGSTVGSNSASNGNNFTNLNGTSSTASTFSNNEYYIPNYAGSTNKSFSIDTVTENNSSTGNGLGLQAGLWSNTAAINQITITAPSTYLFVQYSTASLYGILKS